MFIVLLKFSDEKDQASLHMDAHLQWIKRGFDDGVFLMAGSLKPGLGGGIIAHNCTPAELQDRVNSDPFVFENIVSAEILDFSPSKADQRLAFLVD